jgi:hypothetical protein
MSSAFLCEQNYILLQCEEDFRRLSIAGSQQRRFFDSLQQGQDKQCSLHAHVMRSSRSSDVFFAVSAAALVQQPMNF